MSTWNDGIKNAIITNATLRIGDQGVAGHHLTRIMEVAGENDWSKLKGRTVRADIKNGIVSGIGHIVNDDWFYPATDYKDLK
jgi:hypothetical protein